jgi:hypothetical protein
MTLKAHLRGKQIGPRQFFVDGSVRYDESSGGKKKLFARPKWVWQRGSRQVESALPWR